MCHRAKSPIFVQCAILIGAALAIVLPAQARQNEQAGVRILVVDSRAEALVLRERAEAGESFEALAAQYSKDASGSTGGFIGIVRVSDLDPAYRDALRGLGDGEISSPLDVGGESVLLQRVAMDESRWMEQTSLGLRAYEEGRLAEAEDQLTGAIQAAETLGPADYRLHLSLTNLASVYRMEARFAEAEPLYERALEVAESAIGPDHPDLTVSLNNLALLYSDQGDFAAANSLLERAQQILVTAFGPNHPNVAVGFRNLARLRTAQGNTERAESLYQTALSILEQALGPNDVSVAETLEELVPLLRDLGRSGDADVAARRAADIRGALED